MTEPTEERLGRLRVRPYTVVKGRTQAQIELSLETMIRTSPGASPAGSAAEAAAIIELCSSPQSVAEISAKIGMPLQVAKVLVGDLVVDGKVATHQAAANSDGRPDLALLERVLDGLQSL